MEISETSKLEGSYEFYWTKIVFSKIPLGEMCSYSEFFWSIFFRTRIEQYLSIFSRNVGEYGAEKLRMRTHFTQYS